MADIFWMVDFMVMESNLLKLVEILRDERCSCVIGSGGRIVICHERGVRDLYRILRDEPELLRDALVADKVIGKGAAALLVLGKASEIYAEIISRPALELLERAGLVVSYGNCVPNIINRTGTGICPVESLCMDAVTAEDCLPRITAFLNRV